MRAGVPVDPGGSATLRKGRCCGGPRRPSSATHCSGTTAGSLSGPPPQSHWHGPRSCARQQGSSLQCVPSGSQGQSAGAEVGRTAGSWEAWPSSGLDLPPRACMPSHPGTTWGGRGDYHTKEVLRGLHHAGLGCKPPRHPAPRVLQDTWTRAASSAVGPPPYLLTWVLKSPRMVPGAASLESVSPIMALEARTTLWPSQTCNQQIIVGEGCSHRPPSLSCPAYHGHHRAGAHVADEGRVEGLPLQVLVVFNQDTLRHLGVAGKG